DGRLPYSDGKSGSLVVELAGQTEHRGIYFIPEGSSVSDFMVMAGLGKEPAPGGANLNGRLKNASVVNIRSADHADVCSVTVDRMSGAKRFTLGIPMDLNSATAVDLELVPGIGEKTATRIIEYRQEAGRFKKVSELKSIKGIKDRKFVALRRYFTVE
ncbi:MAG: helix-hairpin-helix domain-containing protein, partial [Deltaproteobacteria bacterium]|nr:helix-hairpin-helix domain-containing protein [Deltaproteobacteria bacterium]